MKQPAVRRSRPDVIDLLDATDPSLCGGKAAGLAVLQQNGCAVPAGTCLTTIFYRRWLRLSGLERRLTQLVKAAADPAARLEVLETIRGRIEAIPLPVVLRDALRDGADADRPELLVVRSSGVKEDGGTASHAGIHESVVVAGTDEEALVSAVKRCWASLWTEAAWTYRERFAVPHDAATMAVVVQRFVPAMSSGVAFSSDPLTGDTAAVVIEACWGTAGDLVGGTMTPDEYRVSSAGTVRRRPGRQTTMIAWRDARKSIEPLDGTRRGQPVLTDAQAREVARLVKDAERATGRPADVEWVFDGTTFWVVQARPITTGAPRPHPGPTLWTRANVKEVFPELPSPLALSYLTLSMNRMFRTYYAAAGYALAEAAQLVTVIRGRPYLNLSLMQGVTIERGGDPAIVSRMFGGAPPAHAGPAAPPSAPKLSFPAMVRLAREMYTTFFRTPARGQRLFRAMRREAAALGAIPLESLDDRALLDNFRRLEMTIIREQMLRQLHEVISAQPRAYMVLEAFLTAWLPADADTLLKHLMTGLGTLPNVRMVHHLMDLAALAVADDRARAYFAADLDAPALADYERALAGTAVLPELRAFLREFGHRAPYESDAMSARFADDPAPVLRMIQLHVRAGATVSGAAHGEGRRQVRLTAMAAVREGLRGDNGPFTAWMRLRVFSLVCSTLQRLIALRDECRHVTTMHVAHLRRVALEIGRRAVAARIVDHPDDVFFLDWDELPRLLFEPHGHWRAVVAERRRQRQEDAKLEAPNIVGGDAGIGDTNGTPAADANGALFGYGVSPGVVIGTVRVLRSVEGIGRLSGEIVVFPAIEPTLTPIFPLVTGIIAEMGGLLSHAAILAREYGVPAVVSVQDATRRLKDGDRIELDGTTGRIRVLERAP